MKKPPPSITFISAPLSELTGSIQNHLTTLQGPIDSYLEDHIRDSSHYRILIDGVDAGYASIFKEALLVQFALRDRHRRYGEEVFMMVRKLESLRSALVPTSDQFYLSHALDNFSRLTKQAYLFEAMPGEVDHPVIAPFHLRRADSEDLVIIEESSGEFFADTQRHIDRGELFITMRASEVVGFGIMEHSVFVPGSASIGMFTIESFRRSGVGRATLRLLQEECRRSGVRPVAGCWYYNHASRETLRSAGMICTGRYLRVEY